LIGGSGIDDDETSQARRTACREAILGIITGINEILGIIAGINEMDASDVSAAYDSMLDTLDESHSWSVALAPRSS
jgi:hypothetical protein